MKNIKNFKEFNEKENWIGDIKLKKGALKKSLGMEEDEKLTLTKIESELDKLEKKDKDDDKDGIQGLNKKDLQKLRRLNFAKNVMKKENNDSYIQYYMFFKNLETIKRLTDKLLEMDKIEIDNILKNRHDWASDHISTSKDDVEEVFNFIISEIGKNK